MTAENTTEITTGKYPKAYRKPAGNVTKNENQKAAAPDAEYLSEKNPVQLSAKNVWISSTSTTPDSQGQKNGQNKAFDHFTAKIKTI